MGLTNHSVGTHAADSGTGIWRQAGERLIALAGNPNVGKSTLFNALTGLHQHTGNWPGKTVTNAQGICHSRHNTYRLVDLPGTYSLLAHSAEEVVARDFLCFGGADAAVVVCDATCPERNLNLVLQTMETGIPTLVCVNLMDEAERKGIPPDIDLLQKRLGVPVVATVAREKRTLTALLDTLDEVVSTPQPRGVPVTYPTPVETAVARLQPYVQQTYGGQPDSRWLSLRLLEGNSSLLASLARERAGISPPTAIVTEQQAWLTEQGFPPADLQDTLATAVTATAHRLCKGVVRQRKEPHAADRKIDRIVTGRRWGYPLMVLLLAVVLWITIEGANIPSDWLATGLFWIEDQLAVLFHRLRAPIWLTDGVVHGAYRVLAWVVSVMLPPMAIFFPLFTLLEDVGYLPRIAYNLDRPFQRCRACGKQALTMCMGFGCNAAGVVGCRIIDSPRERLLAVLTNSFVPCNGRFPTLITLITLLLAGTVGGFLSSLTAALLLTLLILLGIIVTFGVTRLLAVTALRGQPSAFTLELPPYRPPQVGRVIVRSVFDRTLFVLGRAAAVAAPAGLCIWLLANVTVGGTCLLTHIAAFLDPFAALLGLDGAILLAFILGFPANEIVLPLVLMIYMAGGVLPDVGGTAQIHALLLANGWTWVTALCTMVFSLFHWPCSTTLLTVYKETGSRRWTLLAAALPTVVGMALCLLINGVAKLLGA
ncbi:MAG: ferrous iron transport protein B [Clostridia bacterium]|nr:ferrous iron transport protein B [Clostridia bacterium]